MDIEDEFFKKLDNHPRLKIRVIEILQIADNSSGELITADEAETKAIEEVRKLGQEVMQEWAENLHRKQVETFEKENKGRKHVKKKTLMANEIWKSRDRRMRNGSRR